MKIQKVILLIIVIMISTVCYSQNLPVQIGDSILGTDNSSSHKDICLDDNGNLWIGYSMQGVAKYDGNNFFHFTAENSALGSNTINDLYFFNGYLYASTWAGLFKTNTTEANPIWEPLFGTSEQIIYGSGINNNTLYAITGSQDDDTARSLIVVNLNTNIIQEILFEPYYFNSTSNRLSIDFDSDDNVYWSSKYSYGIFKYNGTLISKIIEPIIGGTPRRVTSFTIIDNQIWYSIELESVHIYNISTEIDNQITETPFYDSNFCYSRVFITKDEDERILMTSYASNLAEICVIENNTSTIYKFLDLPLVNMCNSIVYAGGNSIYFSAYSVNQLYFFDLDNYQNFMAGYNDENCKYLGRNQVKAGVRSFGTLFWDGQGKARYEVPVGNGTHSLFATSIWVGGYETNSEQLHFSAERFNQGGFDETSSFYYDFLTGPLTDGSIGVQGLCDTATSIDFNKIWKIDKSDILAHISNIENNTSYYVSPDLYSWPGNGPAGYADILAPFYDSDSDGIYEPYDGDYPELVGDQMLWWITNDVIAPHSSTDGMPMGIELQYTFYAFNVENPSDDLEDLINYQTFLNVKITNRSVIDYDSVFIGLFTDIDLGYAGDDYIGCDVQRSSFFAYNGDDFDESTSGVFGYGENTPVQTVTVLNGPYSHPDNNDIKLSKFIYFNNGSGNPATQDPNSAIEYYNYLTGSWLDNSPLCYGGTGHTAGGGNPDIPTSYMFPGSPTSDPIGWGQGGVPQDDWSEETAMNAPGDRRGVGSIGPINLDSDQTVEIDILFGFIQNANSTKSKGPLDYGPKLDSLISWYNNGTIPSNYNPELSMGFSNTVMNSNIKIYPNPTNGLLHIDASNITNVSVFSIDGKLIDSFGKKSEIDLSQFSNGMYLISIETENERIVEKVMKK